MTNKQWQTIVAICITFTVVFSVIALITMDLLFKRCDTLEEVLYNTKAILNETTETAESALREINVVKQDYAEYVKASQEEHYKLLTMIEEMKVAPAMEIAEQPVINYDYD